MVRLRRRKWTLACLSCWLVLPIIGWILLQFGPEETSHEQQEWDVNVQDIRDLKRKRFCDYSGNRTGSGADLIRDDWDYRHFIRPKFLNNFKNPCFIDQNGAPTEGPLGRQVRCLPYFIVAGFPKAGTTDLWSRLINHQSIVTRHVKEPMFFNHGRYEKEFYKTAYRYLEFYDNAARMLQKLVSPAACQGAFPYHYGITGEASVDTAFDNSRWQLLPGNEGCREIVVTNADYVYHLNPDIKVIFMLRNPVDRLYSDYIYEARFLKYETSQADFHSVVMDTIKNFTDCTKVSSVRSCAYNSTIETKKVRLSVGMYHVFLSDWLDVFPTRNVLVLRSEDTLGINKLDVYRHIFRFLDIRPFTAHEEVKVFQRGPINTRSRPEMDQGDMLPQTRRILMDFYRPFNQKLTQLIPSIDYNTLSPSTP